MSQSHGTLLDLVDQSLCQNKTMKDCIHQTEKQGKSYSYQGRMTFKIKS